MKALKRQRRLAMHARFVRLWGFDLASNGSKDIVAIIGLARVDWIFGYAGDMRDFLPGSGNAERSMMKCEWQVVQLLRHAHLGLTSVNRSREVKSAFLNRKH